MCDFLLESKMHFAVFGRWTGNDIAIRFLDLVQLKIDLENFRLFLTVQKLCDIFA